jgi:uncharacterized protein YbcI
MEAGDPSLDGRPANRGELLAALTRDLIGLHKRFYGRGATKGRAIFAHRNLLLIELEDVFLTVEQTMVEKGQREIVQQTRRTFHSVLRDEFVATVEELTGRSVENYESVTFMAPSRILEIFYLEAVADPQSSDGDVQSATSAEGTYPAGD